MILRQFIGLVTLLTSSTGRLATNDSYTFSWADSTSHYRKYTGHPSLGMFDKYGRAKIKQIKDGLSHTIADGEALLYHCWGYRSA